MQFTILRAVIFIIFLWHISVLGHMIHVPDDQSSIQAGISAAADGDTVLVAPGTYLENINFLGKKIVVASHFVLNHDNSFITSTVINGGSPSHPDTASCVRFISGEDSTTVLEGFTLTGGTGTKWPDIHIGGLYREGGGILIELSSPTIKHNLIVDNQAIDKSNRFVISAGGGAIRSGDGNPRILNNVIRGNRGLYGAGIVLNFSGAIIRNNVIYQNSGGQDFGGSGIWCYSNGPAPKIIENNSIVENSSTGSGQYGGRGGALLVWSTSIIAQNNIIWGNTQDNGGPVAEISGNAMITYSNVEGSREGEGNIDSEPFFADTSLYLTMDSPCADSGNPDSIYHDPEDESNPGFARWPALGGLRNDMGAYGGALSSTISGFSPTGIQDINTNLFNFKLSQNYPNPFNPRTLINYELQITNNVELSIYNLLGQKVATLVSGRQEAGNHQIEWNASGFASGVYYYQFKSGELQDVKRMILVR